MALRLRLLAALMLPVLCHAQPFFLGLDARDGLPQATVEVVLQDAQGFIWVGTQDGLARWDGHRMRVFRRDPRRADSLPGNHIRDLAQGPDGRLWVATLAGGLASIDPDSGAVTRHPGGAVSALAVSPSGELWIGHPGGGLSRLAAGEQRPRRHAEQWGAGRGEVLSLTAEAEGLWIGGPAGLDFMDWAQERITPVPLPGPAGASAYIGVSAVSAEPGQGVVVAASNGLWIRAPEAAGFRYLDLPGPGQASPALTGVARDEQGGLWVASRHGLWALGPAGEDPRLIRGGEAHAHGLPDSALRAVTRDREGLLWLGSESDGLLRLLRPPEGMRHLAPRHRGRSPALWALAARDGDLWLGSDQDGVLRVDAEGQVLETHLDARGEGRGENIWALYPGEQGLWVATDEMEIHFIDERGSHHLADAVSGIDPVRAAAIWDLLEDGQGRLWISTNGDGLHRHDPATGEHRVWRADQADEHGLDSDRVTRLHRDDEGRLWVGTEGDGLYMRVPGDKRFRKLNTLAGGMVEALAHDPRGRLWVGLYDGGVVRLSPQGERRRFGPEEGLPGDTVVGLEVDGQGRVWVMTARGLARIDNDGSVHRLGLAQGVPPLTFYAGAHVRDEQGRIHFGGAEGLLSIDPEQLSPAASGPAPLFSDLRILGEPLWAGATGKRSLAVWAQEGLELAHDEPVFSVDFALPDYRDPDARRYRYRLEGFDAGWRHVAADRATATYTNLSPGRYQLQLEARAADGHWQPAESELAVVVRPPPWRSHGALVAYGLFLLAGTSGGGWLWRQRLRREAAFRREREQRRWVEQLHALARRLAEPADHHTLLDRFLEALLELLPVEAAHVHLTPGKTLPATRVRRARPGVRPVRGGDPGLVSVPLQTRRRRLGVLQLRPGSPAGLNERDSAALAAAVDQAALALDAALLVAEADAANRAKSAFLAKLSHEIRTPVSGMLGLTGLLQQETLNPRSRDYARAIESTGQGLMAILSDILDHARLEAGRMEVHAAPFELITAVEETAALHAGLAAGREIAVVTHVARELPARVVADEVRFRQILGNLLSNAVKFTEKGAITVEVHRHDATRLCLAVADTGPGLSDEAVAELFQPFSRPEAPPRAEGSGLGLVICRELARLMGGDIRLLTRPGAGACFQVLFEAGDDGGRRACTRSTRPVTLVAPDGPAGVLLARRLEESGLRLTRVAAPPPPGSSPSEAVCLVCDGAGLQAPQAPGEHLPWPIREARLADLLDRLSGLPGRDEDLPREPLPGEGHAARVLVAEDNPVNARVVRDVLATAGYRVEWVENGRKVLEALAGAGFDAILMDRHMPEMDGVAATRALREAGYTRLPVIGLTAAVAPEEHADCRRAGMDRVVVKDGNPGPMLEALREALRDRPRKAAPAPEE